MTQQKPRTRLIIGAGSAAMVVILAVPSKKKSNQVPEPAVPAPAVAPAIADLPVATEEAIAPTEDELAAQRERSAELTWGRNPFLALSRPSEPPPELPPEPSPTIGPLPRLMGVSTMGDARMAIIDREIVREGDRLSSGYTVQQIAARTVTLLVNGEERVLSLGAEQ